MRCSKARNKAVTLSKEHPSTLDSMNNLANVLDSQGKYEEAEAMHQQTLQLKEKVLGKEHPSTPESINNLALVLNHQGKYKEAEVMHRQTLQMIEKVLSKEHPSTVARINIINTLASINNLASVLYKQGKHKEAEVMYQLMLQLQEKVLGKEHPSTLASMNNLAAVLGSLGKYKGAEAMYRQTL
jgi:primosomal replication protein N